MSNLRRWQSGSRASVSAKSGGRYLTDCYVVPQVAIDDYLTPEVYVDISRALRRQGNHGALNRIIRELRYGKARLWIVYEVDAWLFGKATFRRDVGNGITFCEGGILNVITYTGDLKRFHLLPKLKVYAREEGCFKIRATGPRAWLRVLGPEWKISAVVFETDV
jgi:hypothetical protein